MANRVNREPSERKIQCGRHAKSHLQAMRIRLRFSHECRNFRGFLGLLSASLCRYSENVMKHAVYKVKSFAIVGPYTLTHLLQLMGFFRGPLLGSVDKKFKM
jgi:hypothetical protein